MQRSGIIEYRRRSYIMLQLQDAWFILGLKPCQGFGIMSYKGIILAGEVNSAMPEWVVSKAVDVLNNHGKALKGSRILVLGIAYKKNVDDMRESPSVHMMEILRSKGAQVEYSDPHVPVFPKMREYSFDLRSVPLTADSVAAYDCVLVATNHDGFDYKLMQKYAKLIVEATAFTAGSMIM